MGSSSIYASRLAGRSESKLLSPQTRAGAPRDVATAKNWRQRELEKLKLFRSGTLFDIADVVESLTQLGNGKNLAIDERETLHRARNLLICEISEVMHESRTAAEARIDSVLNPGESALNKSAN